MKQQLNSFFLKWSKIWWLLPLLLALCATFKGWVIITYPYGSPLDYVANVLFVLLLIGQVGVLIALIKRKKGLSFVLSMLSFIIVFGLGFGVLAFLDSGYSHDPFGMQHPIPAGMKYHEVLHDGDAQPKADVNDRMSYLQIEQVAGGGVYAYDFYYPALSAGEIYLHCYEATEGVALSESSVGKRSRVSVPATHSFGKVVDKQTFTIYEGEWGDYYAVRVEVWHKDAASGKETKLLEKVYKMEGWTR